MSEYAARANYYDIENQTVVDHGFIGGLLTEDVNSVLDLPCGMARNYHLLVDGRRQVVFVDLEVQMIQSIERKFGNRFRRDNVQALVGNMTSLDLPHRFDLIIMPREGIQLLSTEADILKTLKTLSRHLTETGRLMIDIANFSTDVNPDTTWNCPEYFHPHMKNGETVFDWTRDACDGETLSRWRKQFLKPEAGVDFLFRYELTNVEQEPVRWSAKMSLQHISNDILKNFIHESGLTIEENYSDYDGSPYNLNDARSIFLLRRK